ncbi:MurR/RpiR family transcriptional regulator [Pseudonocardia spinosispora]|uniref:MurR/RpiR family transcriptional regulator n=1 Tax=Pseudonocardia spinosispora TaxID=103441 RepID=UPI00042016F5|nr:MurR/RpiR family transcriptional regulator [Pseudonocardia spinosispora]
MSTDSGPGSTPITATVAERTRRGLAQLSHSELKVARALLAAYPAAGLETVAQFAKRAHVSAPTVLRFLTQLGFGNYREFQDTLIREVHEEMGSPLRQITAADGGPGERGGTSAAAKHYSEVLTSSFDALPDAEFDRAVALLSDPRMHLHLLGGRFSQVLADYLAFHLVLIRSSVRGVPEAELERMTMLLELGQRDVLVLFDYRRYDQEMVLFAHEAAARGAHVVLFTDPWMSPIAQVAEIVLPSRVEAPSPFDSLVPAMAVVETVVAAVTEELGEAARTRLRAIESLSRPPGSG